MQLIRIYVTVLYISLLLNFYYISNMKKILFITALFVHSLHALADEGMWLPLLLGQQTYNDMVKKGCKLTKEQIFSLNQKSIKDAIVSFGGFCTGEIVSDKGLLFTNHHCGYDAIVALSTIENNYLKNGHFAASMSAEMPVEGLFVNFLKEIKDVTKDVLTALGNTKGVERTNKMNEVFAALAKANTDIATFKVSRVHNFFRGNQFLMFTYEQYRDVRFVGCPSESFGKYGGDTDNWMWPRHTNDFSVFRVYASQANNPADYSSSNTPLKPKHFLPVSLAPRKQGEFNMILGYPGSTNRFEVSFGAKMSRDIADPAYVKMRDIRLKAMKKEMDKNQATRLKLAGEYANLANYWKFFDLESKQLRSRKVVEKKEALEATFTKWAKGKPDYENILSSYADNYNQYMGYEKLRNYMTQGVFGSTVIVLGVQLSMVKEMLVAGKIDDAKKALVEIDKARKNRLASIDITADKNIFAQVAYAFYNNVDKAQHPEKIYSIIGNFGDLASVETFDKYAADAYSKALILNETTWSNFMANPTVEAIDKDPTVMHAKAFNDNWNNVYLPKYNAFVGTNNDLGKAWVKGLMEMDKTRNFYPDANSTMRFTYGTVQPYKPKNAIAYDYVTTAEGLLEKYIPGDEEFDLPIDALKLIEKKDFGQYIDKERKDLVTCFLNTCDITGGNSGSAVLNGKGELIGLAFDGNSESMDQKLNFHQPLTRCICVDIRYVLWCIDKVGKAPHIIKELKLTK
jgi:hypothetical protein